MRLNLVFFSPKELLAIEETIFDVSEGIKDQEKDLQNQKVKERYWLRFKECKSAENLSPHNKSADKDQTHLQIFLGEPGRMSELLLSELPQPEGFSFQTISEYIYWRVNQLLCFLQSNDPPIMEDFNIGTLNSKSEKEIEVGIVRRYKFEFCPKDDSSLITVIAINDSGERHPIFIAGWDKEKNKWELSMAMTDNLPDSMIKYALEILQNAYPKGKPKKP